MIISVINMTAGKLADGDMQHAIRAVNRQIADDFAPHWGFGAQLRLEGKAGIKKRGIDPTDMRGDAVLYVRDVIRIHDAQGYHARNFAGIPYGFVFLELSAKLKEDWRVTLSHEALELLADPEANLLVQGPDPRRPRHQVFHWFEVCDAVQDEHYWIGDVPVSNFVLPLYFTSSNVRGGRNDFLGTIGKDGKTLRAFSISEGGYIGFFDPAVGRHGEDVNYWHSKRAAERLAIKQQLRTGRGQRRRDRHVLR